MAEIRKHRPKLSLIGEQVRAAMPDSVPRPVTPGSSGGPQNPTPRDAAGQPGVLDDSGTPDPFFAEASDADPQAPKADAASEQAGNFTLRAGDRGGLVSLNPSDISALTVVFREVDGDDED